MISPGLDVFAGANKIRFDRHNKRKPGIRLAFAQPRELAVKAAPKGIQEQHMLNAGGCERFVIRVMGDRLNSAIRVFLQPFQSRSVAVSFNALSPYVSCPRAVPSHRQGPNRAFRLRL